MKGMCNHTFWLAAAEAFPAGLFCPLFIIWINSRCEQRHRNREHDRVADLERDLAVERAKREAAEQLAADRAEHITDLRRSLLMLEAGRPAQPPERSLTHSGEAGQQRPWVVPGREQDAAGRDAACCDHSARAPGLVDVAGDPQQQGGVAGPLEGADRALIAVRLRVPGHVKPRPLPAEPTGSSEPAGPRTGRAVRRPRWGRMREVAVYSRMSFACARQSGDIRRR